MAGFFFFFILVGLFDRHSSPIVDMSMLVTFASVLCLFATLRCLRILQLLPSADEVCLPNRKKDCYMSWIRPLERSTQIVEIMVQN